MARGFGGLPGNMKDLMKQAQKMQAQLQQAQQDAKVIVVEGSAGGGMVNVAVNGDSQLTAVKIDPQVVDPKDVEMLQDLIMAAANEALKKAKAAVEQKVSEVTGGLNIPGLT